MQYPVTVIGNGMLVSKVTIKNTRNEKVVSCVAMIDTGADVSFLCQSLVEKLELHPEDMGQWGASSLDADVMVPVGVVDVHFPAKNWSSDRITMFIKDFTKREEYAAIIGMDILKNTQLFYDGIKGEAWVATG